MCSFIERKIPVEYVVYVMWLMPDVVSEAMKAYSTVHKLHYLCIKSSSAVLLQAIPVITVGLF